MPDRKLTRQQVEEIKELKRQAEAEGRPFVYAHIGKLYGVTGQTIRRNVAPSENDKKPRVSAPYNPVAAQKIRAGRRTFQFYAYKNSEDDRRIIRKLDTVENKQGYIKKLILNDLEENVSED